jgi:hypothetical protein
MANSNFIVDTGLQVGPLTIFAGNGDVVTTGNVSYTGAGIDTFDTVNASGNVSGQNLNTLGTANIATLAVSGSATVSGNLTVNNLTVTGTTAQINTTVLQVSDLNITVAANATTGAQADGAGIDVAGAGVQFRWDNTNTQMTLNKPLSYTTSSLNMDANSLQPKYYVDVMTVVFGS